MNKKINVEAIGHFDKKNDNFLNKYKKLNVVIVCFSKLYSLNLIKLYKSKKNQKILKLTVFLKTKVLNFESFSVIIKLLKFIIIKYCYHNVIFSQLGSGIFKFNINILLIVFKLYSSLNVLKMKLG